jgi:hypothetical protein
MSRSSKWSLPFMFPHQNPVCTSPLPHTCCMSDRLILLDFVPQIIDTNGIHTCNSHWNLQSQCGQEICISASVIFLAQTDAATSAIRSLYRPYRSHHLNIPCSEPTLCSVLWVVSVTAWVVTCEMQFTGAAWNGKVEYKSIVTIQYGNGTLVQVQQCRLFSSHVLCWDSIGHINMKLCDITSQKTET